MRRQGGVAVSRATLNAAQLELLRLVQQRRVGYTRGRYFLMVTGQPQAGTEIHTLRALGLVVLERVEGGRRFPPTRTCVTTAKGDEVLKETANAVR